MNIEEKSKEQRQLEVIEGKPEQTDRRGQKSATKKKNSKNNKRKHKR